MTKGRRILLSIAFLLASSFLMLVVAIPTLFLARRFYSEVIGRWIGRTVLRIWGIEYTTHYSEPVPDRQTIYISNHTSTLDVMLLIALALPRARFFLSGYLRKFPVVAIIGYIIRVFWTVPQEFPDRRRHIFSRADRIMRRTGDSVYLSPEGQCVTTGEIGAFNKGSSSSRHQPQGPYRSDLHLHPAKSAGVEGLRRPTWDRRCLFPSRYRHIVVAARGP